MAPTIVVNGVSFNFQPLFFGPKKLVTPFIIGGEIIEITPATYLEL